HIKDLVRFDGRKYRGSVVRATRGAVREAANASGIARSTSAAPIGAAGRADGGIRRPQRAVGRQPGGFAVDNLERSPGRDIPGSTGPVPRRCAGKMVRGGLDMPSEPTDTGQLVERLRAGDRQALTDLFQHYRDRLHRMVDLRMDPRIQGRVDASDVLQD